MSLMCLVTSLRNCCCAALQRLRGLGSLQRVVGLERKLGVDDERRRVVRQIDHAVRPRAGLQRELERERAGRQPVGDDRLHPPLTEGAARLLVGENVGERRHLAGQVGDVLLRGSRARRAARAASSGSRAWSWSPRPSTGSGGAVMPSSRSDSDLFSSACRPPISSAIVCMRPVISDCACSSAPMRRLELGGARRRLGLRAPAGSAEAPQHRNDGREHDDDDRDDHEERRRHRAARQSVSIMFGIADSCGSPEAGAPGLPIRAGATRSGGDDPARSAISGLTRRAGPSPSGPAAPAPCHRPRGRDDADGRRARARRRRCGRSG